MTQDQEHLRLLAIFHRVLGALCALFALFPLAYVGMGLAMASGAFAAGKPDDRLAAAFVGSLFTGIGAFLLLLLTGWAITLFLAAKHLEHRTRHTFCVVVAALSCCFQPIGTVLGVFTLVVLYRPSVKALFGVDTPASPSTPAAVPPS